MSERKPTIMPVRELLELVVDADSFTSWDEPVDLTGVDPDYRATLERAAERAGTDESVITGRATVHGRPVAIIANEFGFLAGSIGVAAARRITAAVRRATAEGLPLVASTCSGGTRMQEGTTAFVHMIEISRAIGDHRAAGLPYLAHLRHPTTGGVFASWGSLAHMTVGEPGALLGFLGPKVYEALYGEPFPSGVQTSENLAEHGIIDAVVPHEDLSAILDQTLAVLTDGPIDSSRTRRTAPVVGERSAWESIQITRQPDRAGVRELIRYGSDIIVPLRGTQDGQRDSAMMLALTRLDGVPCVVIGQDRKRQTEEHPMGPAALREARRGMSLAEQLGLPLVSVIDTPGAALSKEAEEGAIAGEIARCIAMQSSLRVPTVSVILGQGCGGGALAMLPADVTIAAENAWLSPLPPEGASAIVHRDVDHAPQMAEQQKVSSAHLLAEGTVQALVAEGPGVPAEDFARAMAAEIAAQLRGLTR